MESAGVSLPTGVDRLIQSVSGFSAYFAEVRRVPFLDDTCTKNVLVHDGALTGIVDVDWVCFGDGLLTVALTRASLLGSNRDEAYTDHWCKLLDLTPRQQAVVRLYTALFFLDFMNIRIKNDPITNSAANTPLLMGSFSPTFNQARSLSRRWTRQSASDSVPTVTTPAFISSS